MSISLILSYLLCPFVGAFSKLRKAIISFVMSFHLSALLSVRPSFHKKNSASTGWIFRKCVISEIFENLSRKFKIHQNRTRMTRIQGTLHEDRYTYL